MGVYMCVYGHYAPVDVQKKKNVDLGASIIALTNG